MKSYEYIIIGAGGTGLFLAEMFYRHGFSVALIDKNPYVGGIISREFHEWYHLGTLYFKRSYSLTRARVLRSIHNLLRFYGAFNIGFQLDPVKGRILHLNEEGWVWKSDFYFDISQVNPIVRPFLRSFISSLAERIASANLITEDVVSVKISDYIRHLNRADVIPVPEMRWDSTRVHRDLISSFGGDIYLNLNVREVRKNGEVITDDTTFKATRRVIIAGGLPLKELCRDVHLCISYQPMIYAVTRIKRDVLFVNLNYALNHLITKAGISMISGVSAGKSEFVKLLDRILSDAKRLMEVERILEIREVEKVDVSVGGKRRLDYTYDVIGMIAYAIPGKYTLIPSLTVASFIRETGRFPYRCPQIGKFPSNEKLVKPHHSHIVSQMLNKASFQ